MILVHPGKLIYIYIYSLVQMFFLSKQGVSFRGPAVEVSGVTVTSAGKRRIPINTYGPEA